MTIDDGRVQQMAAALRGARTPRSEPDALWLQLQARIAAGDPGPTLDAIPQAAGFGAVLRSPWLRGVAVGTLACVGSWVAWPREGGTTGSSPAAATAVSTLQELGPTAAPPAPRRTAVSATTSPSPSPSPPQSPQQSPPQSMAQPSPPPTPEDPPRASRSRPRAVGDARSRPPAPAAAPPLAPAADPDVDAELRVMRGVWAALDNGDADLALVRLDEHARRFPEGVLAVEREASRVIALCAAGTDEAARRAANAFLAAHPSSTYTRRIRATCADAFTNAEDPGHP